MVNFKFLQSSAKPLINENDQFHQSANFRVCAFLPTSMHVVSLQDPYMYIQFIYCTILLSCTSIIDYIKAVPSLGIGPIILQGPACRNLKGCFGYRKVLKDDLFTQSNHCSHEILHSN